MALMTARRLVVRGRPPGRAAGSIGATSAQASSVKSVSYNSSVFCTNQLYTDSGKLFKHPLSPSAATNLVLLFSCFTGAACRWPSQRMRQISITPAAFYAPMEWVAFDEIPTDLPTAASAGRAQGRKPTRRASSANLGSERSG